MEKKTWPPSFQKLTTSTVDGEQKEGFFLTREELSSFISQVYTETEWYPDYVAKGDAPESIRTQRDFMRGWVARDLIIDPERRETKIKPILMLNEMAIAISRNTDPESEIKFNTIIQIRDKLYSILFDEIKD